MKKQLLGSIEALGEKIDEKVPTPASSHLLIVNKQANQLDKWNRKIIHYVVEKLLYIMKRARPDLEAAIYFLCRRGS